MSVEPHVYPDHHGYTGDELNFADGSPIVCTEKDAVKLSALDIDLTHVWALDIATQFDDDFQQDLQQRLESLNIRPKSILASGAPAEPVESLEHGA